MSLELKEILRLRRKAKGMTQEQLAQLLHVSRQTISNWETGRANPDYELLKQLSETLETPLSALLGMESAEAQETGQPPALRDEPREEKETEGDRALEEQPPSPSRGSSQRRRLFAVLAATALLAAVFFALWKPVPRAPETSPYPIEWFQQEDVREEGCAYVKLKTPDTPVKRTGYNAEDCYNWEYKIVLQEQGGVAFTIDRVQYYYFWDNGGYHVLEQDGGRLSNVIGSGTNGKTELHANSVRTLVCQEQTQRPFLGVGVLLEGTDGNGRALSFRYYVPFSTEIRNQNASN